MLKLICCCAIVTGSFLYGSMKASELYKREKFLEGVISALTIIRQDIAYCKTPVSGLFHELNSRKEFGELLIFDLGETESDERLSILFEKKLKELKPKLYITDDDITLLCEFITAVECADSETAIALCARTTELLRQSAAVAQEKSKTSGRLYKALGLFVGISAVLFFI